MMEHIKGFENLEFTECSASRIISLQKADSDLVKLQTLLEVSYVCKVCHRSSIFFDSCSASGDDGVTRWHSLESLRAHLETAHSGSTRSPMNNLMPRKFYQRNTKGKQTQTYETSHRSYREDKSNEKGEESSFVATRNMDSTTTSHSKTPVDSANATASEIYLTANYSKSAKLSTNDDNSLKIEISDTINTLAVTKKNYITSADHSSYESVEAKKIDVLSQQVQSQHAISPSQDNIEALRQTKLQPVAVNNSVVYDENDDDDDSYEKLRTETTEPCSHISRHEKTRTCPECDTVHTSVEECLKHFVEKHDAKTQLQHVQAACALSQETGSNKSQWSVCPLCSKSFKKAKLASHVMLMHVWRPSLKKKCRKKDHLCSLCGKVFHNDQSYYIHLKCVHRGMKRKYGPHKPKQFKCTLCEYTSCEQRRITSHMKFVHAGVKAYSCQFCSYSTWERTSMRSHMYRHRDTKRFSCEHCTYQCIQKKQLRAHLLHKHQLHLPKTGSTRLPSGGTKNLRQTVCAQVVEMTNRAIATEPGRIARTRKAHKKMSRQDQSQHGNISSLTKHSTSVSKNRPIADAIQYPPHMQVLPEWGAAAVRNSPSKLATETLPSVSVASSDCYPGMPPESFPVVPCRPSDEPQQVTALSSAVVPSVPTYGNIHPSPVPQQLHLQNSTVVQTVALDKGLSTIQENTNAVPSEAAMDMYHMYQLSHTGPVLVPTQNASVGPKTCPQYVTVDQPQSMTILSNAINDYTYREHYKSPGSHVEPRILTNAVVTPVKAQGGINLAETFAVTPIYAQNPPDRGSNLLNPNNTQGSFIYILK